VGGGEVAEDGVRVLFGRADDVGHAGLFPAVVLRGVAALAGGGSGVVCDGYLREECGCNADEEQRQEKTGAASHGREYRMRGCRELSRRDDEMLLRFTRRA